MLRMPDVTPHVRRLAAHPLAVSWALSTTAWAVFLGVASPRPFVHDSRDYWNLRQSYSSIFSLLDFRDGLRSHRSTRPHPR